MRHKHLASVAILLALAGPAVAAPSAEMAAAIADPGRTAADKALDAERKPAEVLEFIGVKAGDIVVDIIPGAGYFSRLFAKTVGPQGRVILYIPASVADKYDMGKAAKGIEAAAPDKNVTALIAELKDTNPTGKADVVWVRQNYHDYHSSFLAKQGTAELNRTVFASLKPGGLYVIQDHVGKTGSGPAEADATHRIDPELVKQEVVAAGFVFDGESKAFANPADDHSKIVFDPSVRGKTDQFVYKFRKPG